MRIPTIPEMGEYAGCLVFGHDWYVTRRSDGTPVDKCRNCGETRTR